MQLQLRDYQQKAVQAFYDALPTHKRQLISLATGLGKTIVFGEVAKRFYAEVDHSKPIVVMAHRDELLNQAAEKISLIWPDVRIGRVQGKYNEQNADVLLCSTQTLVMGRSVKQPGLVIYDESHHARAQGAMGVLERLGVFREDGPALLGVTATPFRTDGLEMGDLFTTVTYEMSILDGIMQGYLCDVKGKRVHLPVELRALRITNGDYNQKELGAVMNDREAIRAVVDAITMHAPNHKMIVFGVDVAHANALAKGLNEVGIAAAAVDGTTPEIERKRILKDFSQNKLQALVNCQLLTEGYDEPSVDALVIARPTRSRSLYVQMVGRVLRLYPSKESALVLDLTGASEDKNLQTFTQLMKTQDTKKQDTVTAKNGSEAKHAQQNEVPDMNPNETVVQWQQRLSAADEERRRKLLENANEVNLFADRSKFRWMVVGNSYAINYGEDKWAFLYFDEERLSWWPLIERGKGRYFPLFEKALPLTFAQGVVEGYLETLEKMAIIEKDANWRDLPMSDGQKHVLDKYRVRYNTSWTRGMASDELGKRFAKRQMKEVAKVFQPSVIEEKMQDERVKKWFEGELKKLRRA